MIIFPQNISIQPQWSDLLLIAKKQKHNYLQYSNDNNEWGKNPFKHQKTKKTSW